MDAGDADGADALLSLAALANAEEDDDLPGLKLPASAQRELEEKLESLAAQAAEAAPSRPRRSRTTPAKADVRPLIPQPCMLAPMPASLQVSLHQDRVDSCDSCSEINM